MYYFEDIDLYLKTIRIIGFLISIFEILCFVIACIRLSRIAKDKGYDKLPGEAGKWPIAVKCFMFGIPHMIAVASLPDISSKSELNGFAKNDLQSSGDTRTKVEKSNRTSTSVYTWRCPNCKTNNRVSDSYCLSCGIERPVNVRAEVSRNQSSMLNNNEWRCNKCGSVNPNYVGTCSCGEIKPRR